MGMRIYKSGQHDVAAAVEFFGFEFLGCLEDVFLFASGNYLSLRAEDGCIFDYREFGEFASTTRASAAAKREQLADIGDEQGLGHFQFHHGGTETQRITELRFLCATVSLW